MIKKIITKTIITFAAVFCLFAEDAVTQLPVQIQADTYSDTEEEVKSEEADEYTEKERRTYGFSGAACSMHPGRMRTGNV